MNDIRRLTPDEYDDHPDSVHDSDGNRYEVADTYYTQFLAQTSSRSVRLVAARYLIDSKLKSLTVRQKEVLTKRMNGQSLRSIAGDLGIDVSTVNEHLKVSIKKLKKLIKQTEGVILNGEDNIS